MDDDKAAVEDKVAVDDEAAADHEVAMDDKLAVDDKAVKDDDGWDTGGGTNEVKFVEDEVARVCQSDEVGSVSIGSAKGPADCASGKVL